MTCALIIDAQFWVPLIYLFGDTLSLNFTRLACCNSGHSQYSVQKKKVNGPEVAKYFSPVERGKFFLAPSYYHIKSATQPENPRPVGNEAELQY